MSYYTNLERLEYIGLKKSAMLMYNLALKKIDSIRKAEKLMYRPIAIQLETTTKCNLRCRHCESTLWDRKGHDMAFSDFKKIIDKFPYLIQVLLQGIGEPFMCKDIFRMIEYCESNKIISGTTTNGTLLNKEMAEKIVDSRLSWLIVSIDGSAKGSFEKIRIGANFDQVIENIEYLAELRKKTGKPRIIVHFTASNNNINELPEIVKLSKKIGAEFLEIQDMHYWGKTENKPEVKSKTLYSDKEQFELSKKYINESMLEAKKIGIQFDILGTGARKTLFTESDTQIHANQLLCKKMWRSCSITYDGFVIPCTCTPDPNIINFGNILEQDFDSIWNGSKYLELRKLRMEGKLPSFCETCTAPHIDF